MTIYFVRHGESVNNVAKNYQGPDVELSEQGKEQAKIVAQRFKNIPVDTILASSYTRAHDTAKAIQEVVEKPLEVLDSLVERKRPSSFHNKPYNDPELEEIRQLIDNHPDPTHHHSDEENFFDLKKRAEEVILMLEKRPEENIVVVSHGVFIKTIFLSMMLGDLFTLEIFERAWHIVSLDNTAISICEFKRSDLSSLSDDTKKRWRIKTINDFAHLAEPS